MNNAGYSVRGALEEVPLPCVKAMYEVNVFGIINMLQSVIPVMRQQNSGKIINIGSISGQFAQAINGAYCSSKFAVEALSDALRMELRQFNIQSTVIEPGPIETKFFNTLGKNSDPLMLNENSAYRNFYKSDIINRANQNRTDTKIAAEQIVKAIGSIKLKPRYKVAVPAKFRIVAALPDVLREIIIKR